MSDISVLSIENVSWRFGEVEAESAMSLLLVKGEILGTLGTNGARKTTTIMMLLGLLKPTEGAVIVLDAAPSDPATRAKIGYMLEIAY